MSNVEVRMSTDVPFWLLSDLDMYVCDDDDDDVWQSGTTHKLPVTAATSQFEVAPNLQKKKNFK